MKAKSIVILYYIISALYAGSMGFIMGVYSNFLRSAGLDEFWLNMVNVSYFVVITICEIPTGIFADIFGRKGSFVISCFLQTISFAVYGFSRSFGGFVLAETIGAVGKTFASGAFDSWLVDSIKHTGEEHDLLKIFSRRGLITRVVLIISAILGGFIGDYGLNLPFFAGSIAFFICGIIAVIFMKETYFEKCKFSFVDSFKEIKNTWNRSIIFTKSDRNFRFVLIISSIQMFAVMAPNMEWQKVFSNLGFSNSANGIIGGLISVAMIVGIILSRKAQNYVVGEKRLMVFIQILIGAFIALTVSFVNIYPVLLFFFLHEIGRGMFGPVMESYTQKSITSSKERATLSSFVSMTGHFGGAIGLLASGLIAKYAGIPLAWIVSGLILIIVTLFIGSNHNKDKG
jgi:MFS family permease